MLQLSLPKKKVLDSEKELSPLSISSSGNNNSIPNKLFSNSKTSALTSHHSSVNKLHRNNTDLFNVSVSDDADEGTYFEIGQIDDTLTEMIQPLTDAEEAALGALQAPSTTPEVPLINPYTRYIEFKIEDNPPSPSLLRSMKQPKYAECNPSLRTDETTANYTANNYLEFRIEDNPPSPNLLKALKQTETTSMEERYIEFNIENNPPSSSVIRPMSGTSSLDLENLNTSVLIERNSPLHDFNVHLVSDSNKQYVEFMAEDNPPSPSLNRSRKQPNGLSGKQPEELSRKLKNLLSLKQPNESYTEDGYEDIIMANSLVECIVSSADIEDGHLDIVNEDCYTYPSSRINQSVENIQPRDGISLVIDGYFEADV